MKIKLYALFVIVLSVVVGLLGTVAVFENKSAENPKAKQGYLDLSHYDFNDKGPLKLDGEWEFIPNKLVDSQYFIDNQKTPQYVKVPSLWRKYSIEGQQVPLFTSATYRLVVKTNNKGQILGIKTSNIRMSNTLIVNGEKIAQSGVPKEDSSYVAHNTPYAKFFYATDHELEIIVHVANFDYASGGGIIGSIYFGDERSITHFREKSLAYDWIMIASLLTMAVYYVGFYWHLRKDVHLFYFSLFCFAMVLYSATHGEKLLHGLYPGMPYALFQRLQGISTVLIGFFLLLYYHFSLQSFSKPFMIKLLSGYGAMLMLSLFLPASINSQFQLLHSIYLLMVFLYIIYIQVNAIRQKVTGAMYLVNGSITLIIYFVVGTLNVMGDTNLNTLPPFLPFIYLLMLSLFMAHRFSDTYRKNEELSQQLLKVDKLKDEFLAKTSHEFKTPLHGIINITQTLIEDLGGKITVEQRESLSIVTQIAKRLARLVNDILDLSKLKQGQLELDPKPLDVHSSVHGILQVFRFILKDKEVELINAVPKNLANMYADEFRFGQILFNLIDNAVKHTKEGFIEITAEERGNYIELSIRDTGTGIPQDLLENIFQPFAKRSLEGTGLGLPITKQLIELQDGFISIHSDLGQGAIVKLQLPISKGTREMNSIDEAFIVSSPFPHPSMRLETPQDQYIGGEYTILVADDDVTNLKLLIDGLSREGYNVLAVQSGREVLEQLATKRKIDLILLDVMMPEMSGYEVCKEVRKVYGLIELPIVMLTAAIHQDEMQAAYHSGANDFLHKPFEIHELTMRIRSLLMMNRAAVDMANMEVAFLQAQIKPHFLFNVFNTILSLSYTDIEKARHLINKLAEFLRGSFEFTNTEHMVPLSRELALVKAYVEIERARFKDRIKVEYQLSQGVEFLLPPLILQPIVENAIRHGIMKRAEGGWIKVGVEQVNETYVIYVEDNGVGMTDEQCGEILSDQYKGKSVGLRNIQKRLFHFYRTGLDLKSEVGRGTRVVIHITPQAIGKRGVEMDDKSLVN
ncbi:ATP-binding protein [Ammoniphilus sp. CFH 90114]|uniref:ATP-binding protein n=1 Tax=Ammoniphilus sp. CFH 90114 TaxID=2493665 RepID=UPI00100EDACC|nr:ATP-binding protein [Ammoniphilus sp. CFH 90114]RXT15446.1 response regulator [Ammoniphilus sp. CFH 90114]